MDEAGDLLSSLLLTWFTTLLKGFRWALFYTATFNFLELIHYVFLFVQLFCYHKVLHKMLWDCVYFQKQEELKCQEIMITSLHQCKVQTDEIFSWCISRKPQMSSDELIELVLIRCIVMSMFTVPHMILPVRIASLDIILASWAIVFSNFILPTLCIFNPDWVFFNFLYTSKFKSNLILKNKKKTEKCTSVPTGIYILQRLNDKITQAFTHISILHPLKLQEKIQFYFDLLYSLV